MKNITVFAICSLFFSQTFFAQTVRPGDVNNNGIVNEFDLLYLGLAFGETGTARATIDSSWTAQTIIENWTGSFPNGLNFVYADCNGDGVVSEADADVIEKNYLESHNDVPFIPDDVLAGVAGEDPKIAFLTEDLVVPEGGSIDLDIGLGSANIPVDSILGLAFTIKVNPELFQGNRIKFKFEKDSWLGADDAVSITKNLKQNPKENGRFTVAFTRTDKMPVADFGLIGKVSFVLETDIIDLLKDGKDSLQVQIDSVIITDDNLEPLPAIGNSINLQLEELIDSTITSVDSTTTSIDNPILEQIKVFPNPTAGWLLIKTANIQTAYFEVLNSLGQVVLRQKGTTDNFQSLDLRPFPQGSYWLRFHTEYGLKHEHIQKF